MANIHVTRLSRQRKGSTDFILAPLPDLPEDFVRRFPSMRQWFEDVQELRRQDEANIKNTLLAIRSET